MYKLNNFIKNSVSFKYPLESNKKLSGFRSL